MILVILGLVNNEPGVLIKIFTLDNFLQIEFILCER